MTNYEELMFQLEKNIYNLKEFEKNIEYIDYEKFTCSYKSNNICHLLHYMHIYNYIKKNITGLDEDIYTFKSKNYSNNKDVLMRILKKYYSTNDINSILSDTKLHIYIFERFTILTLFIDFFINNKITDGEMEIDDEMEIYKSILVYLQNFFEINKIIKECENISYLQNFKFNYDKLFKIKDKYIDIILKINNYSTLNGLEIDYNTYNELLYLTTDISILPIYSDDTRNKERFLNSYVSKLNNDGYNIRNETVIYTYDMFEKEYSIILTSVSNPDGGDAHSISFIFEKKNNDLYIYLMCPNGHMDFVDYIVQINKILYDIHIKNENKYNIIYIPVCFEYNMILYEGIENFKYDVDYEINSLSDDFLNTYIYGPQLIANMYENFDIRYPDKGTCSLWALLFSEFYMKTIHCKKELEIQLKDKKIEITPMTIYKYILLKYNEPKKLKYLMDTYILYVFRQKNLFAPNDKFIKDFVKYLSEEKEIIKFKTFNLSYLYVPRYKKNDKLLKVNVKKEDIITEDVLKSIMKKYNAYVFNDIKNYDEALDCLNKGLLVVYIKDYTACFYKKNNGIQYVYVFNGNSFDKIVYLFYNDEQNKINIIITKLERLKILRDVINNDVKKSGNKHESMYESTDDIIYNLDEYKKEKNNLVIENFDDLIVDNCYDKLIKKELLTDDEIKFIFDNIVFFEKEKSEIEEKHKVILVSEKIYRDFFSIKNYELIPYIFTMSFLKNNTNINENEIKNLISTLNDINRNELFAQFIDDIKQLHSL